MLTLCMALLTACGGDPPADVLSKPVRLTFAPVVGDAPFSCAGRYAVGMDGVSVEFTDFKMFVYDVRLVRANGEEVPVTLDEDDVWQHGGAALLDFEDGSAACANGTSATRLVVEGVAPDYGDYRGVRLTLGLPPELNHADVGALPSPLNLPSMFWSWRGGRKFLRLDGRTESGAGLRVHLGSTGCTGSDGAIMGCSAPNRAELAVSDVNPLVDVLVVDAGELFEGVVVSPEADSGLVCMSEPDSASCPRVFEALGVEHGAGVPREGQRFLRGRMAR